MRSYGNGTNCFMAANGYDGFRSYFERIFNPHEYTRLFILKGGPGTGKSSLMKKIRETLGALGYKCESVYCSSDPSSLDGVIAKKGEKKFAILDGTAPHETDTKIPGAVDEIVNLGAFWNEERLSSERNAIETAQKQKSKHYRNAYEYLRLAGEISGLIEADTAKAYSGFDVPLINDVLFDLKQGSPDYKQTTRLLSSFSKDGFVQQGIEREYPRGISVTGAYGSEYIFMNHLSDEVRRRRITHTRFPSPFSDRLTEAVYINDSDTLVSVGRNYGDVVDTSVFLDVSALNSDKEKLSFYTELYEEILGRSQKEFSLASRAHFELEAIYGKTMDFDAVSRTTDDIISKIKKLS